MLPFQDYVESFFNETLQWKEQRTDDSNLAPQIIERLLQAIINANQAFNFALIEDELWQKVLREHSLVKAQLKAPLGMITHDNVSPEMDLGIGPGIALPGAGIMGMLNMGMIGGNNNNSGL